MLSSGQPLDTARHIKYWQRCFRSVLPHHYTSNDSSRLALGFFIIAAVDLLGSSESAYSPDYKSPNFNADIQKSSVGECRREQLRTWVVLLQHPFGGFCGSPQHVLPDFETRVIDTESMTFRARDPDNVNIAATYFALLSLGILSKGWAFLGVRRTLTLKWLKKLQRRDGSFGEIITEDGYVGGGRDMRYCHFAAAIRWALGGASDPANDIDVDALVAYIRRGQTYDGGVAESSMHESHAGYAWCAVAALSLLDLANPKASTEPNRYLHAGIPSIPSLVHFLINRQLTYLDPKSADDSAEGEEDDSDKQSPPDLSKLSLSDPTDPSQTTGFNGRLNKVPDTCYAWWVSATLAMLGEKDLIDRRPARKFILEKTQHLIGGFSKHPGGPPDVYHAYLGLAALATMAGEEEEEGLKKIDPRLCVSTEVVDRINRARESLLHPLTESSSDDSDDSEEYLERRRRPSTES